MSIFDERGHWKDHDKMTSPPSLVPNQTDIWRSDQPKPAEETVWSNFVHTYQPEIWEVEKDMIYALKTCTEYGLDYAREALADHDHSLGRTIRRNKEMAEIIEKDIRLMEQTLEALKNYETRDLQ